MNPRAKNETGVIIESGAQDWQIFQQDKTGSGQISLRGRWRAEAAFKKAEVAVRVMQEAGMQPAGRAFDWRPAQTGADGTWSILLSNVPQGGLYRIETALQVDDCPIEWAQRGDMVHHVGVGDIWVIAGQSNSAGYGKSPAQDAPELGLHMFHACGGWRLATHPLGDSTGSQYPTNTEGGNASHSPYLAFARRLKQALGYPIGLIPSALGGSPLSRWTRKANGDLFENMLAYIRDAGGACRGLLWYQGESDTGPAERVVYRQCFADMIADVRREMGDPRLPVITVQLNRWVGEPADGPSQDGWEIMREVQRQIARDIPGVAVIPTLDLGLSDGVHNNSSANLVIGQRMADAALAIAYGRDVRYLAPDLRTVRRAAEQALELVFGNVDIRLSYENVSPEQWPFAVRDAAGVIPLRALTLTGKDTIRLDMSRAPVGVATVVGGPTANPSFVVPFDVGGYLPMLGFRVELREE